ncbi:MAG: ArnT family glycosyltransferase [Phenylobacterium sp.]
MPRSLGSSPRQQTAGGAQVLPGTFGGYAFEWLGLAVILALFFGSLVYRSDTLAMQLWDESRNANNALGAALGGHWLAPYYGDHVDHWNTKPPLLIWSIAGLLKLGIEPLWALRLPNILATFATAALIGAAFRYSLKDRVAALAGPALLLCSSLYMGFHGARTGDYDAFESFFIVVYVLGFWQAFSSEPVKRHWLAAVVIGVFGAVLTKGVAGILPLPGLVIAMAASPGRALSFLKDIRTWIYGALTIALCLGYYLSRETYDPGYIAAVLQNELGGRYLKVSDEHHASALYYVKKLALGFEPGGLLSPLVLLTLMGADRRRRELSLFALAGGLALLLVISTSQTKLAWYATPIVPLFSIAVAVGVSDALRWAARRGSHELLAAGAILLAFVSMGFLRQYQSMTMTEFTQPWGTSQIQYGTALTELKRQHRTPPLTIVDSGFRGVPDDPHYNPIIDFYTTLYGRNWRIARTQPGAPLADGSLVLTCDPTGMDWLRTQYVTEPVMTRAQDCVFSSVTRPVR